MKKLILGFLLIFGISSTLLAEVDFIALATNGEFNEQSAGVKVLNDEEMSQVVGGATLFDNNGRGNLMYHYGMVNNGGTRVSYTAYYKLHESYRNELLPLNVDNGSGQYIPVVSATLNHLTNQVSVSIIGMNQYNPVYTRPADRYYANKLLENRQVINEVNNVIRNHSRYFWGY
ncbi:bacteriocin [Helicobacter rodentium]|uniref:bacteriocin n=1 Tax=Helicobacter rodentium TaxID=59617 RepID=UPI00047A2B02|nr:bacteriocin [Helicobacter rodentium]